LSGCSISLNYISKLNRSGRLKHSFHARVREDVLFWRLYATSNAFQFVSNSLYKNTIDKAKYTIIIVPDRTLLRS